MKRLIVLACALAAVGCQISPVVTEPMEPRGRYDDCRRAAKDYCREVVGGEDQKSCVARSTFECVTAGGE